MGGLPRVAGRAPASRRNSPLTSRELWPCLFRELLYDDEHRESIALVMGQVEAGQDVLCRVHSHYLGAHVFNSVACDGREQMVLAQALIAHEGRGLIIWLDQEGRGHGYLALMRSRALQAQGWSQTKAYRKLGYAADARQYTSAAGIPLTGPHPLAVDPGTNERLRRRYAEKVQ